MKHPRSPMDGLPDDQQHRLAVYEELLRTHALPRGMIAATDGDRIRERHILDALRARSLLPAGSIAVADLGSGAGLPGIPLAIARPDASFVLFELRRARAAFLEMVVETVPVPNAVVHLGRIDAAEGPFDVCLARAFAPASETWRTASTLLRPGGVLLYWAGARFDPAADLPANVRVRVSPTTALANAGVVAIITSQ